MESLSSVGTIVRIAQDIAGAVATVSKNRIRCQKLAKRVQCIGELLRELNGAEAATTTTTDVATSKLLSSLEEALRRALLLVRSCQGSGCPRSLIAGGRMADRFDEVDGEIDRCLLDLGIANRILIARLERLMHQSMLSSPAPARTETVTLRIGMPCDDNADHIKRRIRMVQGVMDVGSADAASKKDQFRVTVSSDAVDIPLLLEQIKEKLNRNVELVATHTRNANKKTASTDHHRMDKQNNKRSAIGEETKKEKTAAMAAAAANMAAASHQVPAPYIHLPFAVALVPIGDASSMYHHLPPPYSYLQPCPQGPPVTYVQRQSDHNTRYVHFDSTREYDCARNAGVDDAVKEYGSKDEKKAKVGGAESAAADNVTAIGVPAVPVHTVITGVREVVPPPLYGHGCWQNSQDRHTGGPTHATAYDYNSHSWYPDLFSDENPNACSVM